MLENIGKYIQTILLVALIVVLSLVMAVVGFSGPTLDGCRSQGATYAARVYGTTITEGDFRAAYALTGFNRYPAERARSLRLKELTLQGLIERELLVREAERLGFTANAEEVMQEVVDEEVILLGGPVDAPEGYPQGRLPQSFAGRDGAFSYENMRQFIQNHLRRSMEEFTQWQIKETLAERARQTITATISVSPREIWDAYVGETERAQLSYVRFNATYFRDEVVVEPQALTDWIREHQSEVDQEYRRQRHRYTGLELQVRARHILIKAGEDATPAARETARARAQALLDRVRAGEDFASLARQNSEDEGSARRGGDLGFNPRGRMVAPFDQAQFDTQPGNVVDHLVETNFGYHVIRVDARREGDVPEDEAKRELGEDLYRRAQAGELAHQAAIRALAYLRESHSMEELDERLLHGWDTPAAPEGQPEGQPEEQPEEQPEGQPEEQAEPERHPLAPQVAETRRFGRADRALSGAFDSGPLTRAAFEMTMDEPLPEEPIRLADDWYVYRLIERTDATREGFTDEVRARIQSGLLLRKRREVLSAYVNRLVAEARASGEIRENQEILQYQGGPEEEDEEGEASAAR